jgi:hypothetical protein
MFCVGIGRIWRRRLKKVELEVSKRESRKGLVQGGLYLSSRFISILNSRTASS